jgi:hypothetical protein
MKLAVGATLILQIYMCILYTLKLILLILKDGVPSNKKMLLNTVKKELVIDTSYDPP